MPPVTKAGNSAFRKDVDFVAKDDDERVATGVVMVPDTADLQHDFAREETIRSFADQFETFAEAGEAGGGIMHAVWPDEWMDLERNEVLDEAETIGNVEVPAGAWVQDWGFNQGDLWQLVKDDILEGYSIGAIDVQWNGPFEQDENEVEDVEVPDELDDGLIWELVDGIIREVSAVDIPAVPDAQILETKADAEKRLGDYLGDRDGFIDEAISRGHTEAEAERLWVILNEAVEVDGAGEPGKQSFFERMGKAAFGVLTRSDDGATEDKAPEGPDGSANKEGRTLSKQNRESLFATIDASLDVLEDAGVDHGMKRFTDCEDTDFDLSEHSAREWGGDGDDDDGDADETPVNNATGSDTPDDFGSTDAADDTDTRDMSDDTPDDGEDGDKPLAEQNAEQINELTQAVEDLTETLSDPKEKSAEIEIDGETYEVPESQVKTALGVDEDEGVDVAEAIEQLKSEVDETQERIDRINQQSGTTDQIDAAATGDEDDDNGLDDLGKALS